MRPKTFHVTLMAEQREELLRKSTSQRQSALKDNQLSKTISSQRQSALKDNQPANVNAPAFCFWRMKDFLTNLRKAARLLMQTLPSKSKSAWQPWAAFASDLPRPKTAVRTSCRRPCTVKNKKSKEQEKQRTRKAQAETPQRRGRSPSHCPDVQHAARQHAARQHAARRLQTLEPASLERHAH